jgi:DNA-binding beta-propeller fold protein YncE
MAVGPNGLLYAVEWGNRRVQVFNTSGTPLFLFGSAGIGDGEFAGPTRIAIDHDGKVYISDSENARIQIFSANGDYLGQFGSRGSGPGQFSYPFGLAFDADGNLLVADWQNHRIQKFGWAVVPSRTSTWGQVKTHYR